MRRLDKGKRIFENLASLARGPEQAKHIATWRLGTGGKLSHKNTLEEILLG
jgi:hypothetical protein